MYQDTPINNFNLIFFNAFLDRCNKDNELCIIDLCINKPSRHWQNEQSWEENLNFDIRTYVPLFIGITFSSHLNFIDKFIFSVAQTTHVGLILLFWRVYSLYSCRSICIFFLLHVVLPEDSYNAIKAWFQQKRYYVCIYSEKENQAVAVRPKSLMVQLGYWLSV